MEDRGQKLKVRGQMVPIIYFWKLDPKSFLNAKFGLISSIGGNFRSFFVYKTNLCYSPLLDNNLLRKEQTDMIMLFPLIKIPNIYGLKVKLMA